MYSRRPLVSSYIILVVLLLSTAGCKDPIPSVPANKFDDLSQAIKQKMEEILPERQLIMTNFRTNCEIQEGSDEYPFLGTIYVNYRGKESPVEKSNQLRIKYAFRESNQDWIYRSMKVEREILGEDLQDQEAMFEAVLRIPPSKKKELEPLL